MNKRFQILVVALLCAWSPLQAATVSPPAADFNAVNSWLKQRPEYRLANMQDCACASQVDDIRKGGGAFKPMPAYLPFYASGRFDGTPGFAVLVIKKDRPFAANILVFSAERSRAPVVLRYPFSTDSSLEWIGLFKKERQNRPDELLIGTFGSEAEAVRVPKVAN